LNFHLKVIQINLHKTHQKLGYIAFYPIIGKFKFMLLMAEEFLINLFHFKINFGISPGVILGCWTAQHTNRIVWKE